MQVPTECVRHEPCLLEALLDLLEERATPHWPGADGLTLEDAVAEYVEAARRGQVPPAEELARMHPHLAGEIAAALGGGRVAEGAGG